MKKTRLLSLLVMLCLVLGLMAGCGTTAASTAESAPAASSVEVPETPEPPEPPQQPDAPASNVEEESSQLEGTETVDNTAANAAMDYTAHLELVKSLTASLPITEEPVTLTYFMGFESNSLNYMENGDLMNHQVWKYLQENSGVQIDLTVVDSSTMSDKLNLMLASGEYSDLLNLASYSPGVEAAYDEDIIIDLGDYLEEDMPNYWTIINSDQNLLEEVQDGHKFLAIYPIKDQVANPSGIGPFIRMDWLEDLDMEVPQTYDELTDVLRAFKTEKGAAEPMALQNTVSMANGVLMGGFGSMAELSTNGLSGNAVNGYYQEDGKVIYGATTDGTRKYLSWLHDLYTEDLINFENMQNREANPFSELNATRSADGSTGYIFSNQPFGGNYSTMAASQYGDERCNWWPVQDVAQEAGQTIPFFEEITLVDNIATTLSISTQCKDVDVALKFLDYGYSYEGALLYNMGFQKGSGHDVESWDYDENGDPQFDGEVLAAIGPTNIASSVLTTKDLAGIVMERRLAFEFGERELSCFDAWSTHKTTENILGSATQLTSEESVEASGIYSDILTYVSTSVLQFINGDLNVNDDAAWDAYVANIDAMGIDDLSAIIQGAYDRANS